MYSSLALSRTGCAGHYQSGDAIIEEIDKEGKRDLVDGIKDTKVSSYDTEHDIKMKVQLIRKVIRGCKYLENTWESCEQFDITKSVPLSNGLVNCPAIAKNNLTKCLPKILKGEPYKINIVCSTLAEQEEAEKIEDCTISEIKQKILHVFEISQIKICGKTFTKKKLQEKLKLCTLTF